MNNWNSQLCPKCNKLYKRRVFININYSVFVHKAIAESVWLYGLIEYCIVNADYDYKHPKPDVIETPLNPNYKRKSTF